MSAGEFITGLYRSDDLEIHKIRIQVETSELEIDDNANASVTGPATSSEWVKASQGARSFGLSPRKLRVRFVAGSEPAGYLAGQFYEVVVFDPLYWEQVQEQDTGTYLGAPITVKGKVAERRFPS